MTLLSGKSQTITPAKWFSFMREVVQGRDDPMDPAAGLSEEQMDRLWNITDHLKRETLKDPGFRGSWTAFMQQIGLRGAMNRIGQHVGAIAASAIPGGKFAAELLTEEAKRRDVMRELDRFMNPPTGQGLLP